MPNTEKLRSYIKEVHLGEEVEFYFVKITWLSSHEPMSDDVLLYRVPLEEWEREKHGYYGHILNNKKNFQMCGHCFKLKHVGHMSDDFLCQMCAETNFGVIH